MAVAALVFDIWEGFDFEGFILELFDLSFAAVTDESRDSLAELGFMELYVFEVGVVEDTPGLKWRTEGLGIFSRVPLGRVLEKEPATRCIKMLVRNGCWIF